MHTYHHVIGFACDKNGTDIIFMMSVMNRLKVIIKDTCVQHVNKIIQLNTHRVLYVKLSKTAV